MNILLRYLVLILICYCSCAPKKKDYDFKGMALGTSYSISYSGEDIQGYQKQLDSIFTAVNASMSTYIPTSMISKINAGDSTIIVDAMFKEVLALSKKVHKASDGAFDPTIGQLVNAWGFGAGKSLQQVDSTVVDTLLQYVGLDKVSLTSSNKVLKAYKETYLEFNAIAKGYCIDRIGVFLDQKEVQHYLIELGGEVLAKGQNERKQEDWIVGIDDPHQPNERSVLAKLRLKNRAMATSGNYRKYRIDSETGVKYVHSIDPHTGYPKLSNVLSVSVLASSCALADAYATAFMIMELSATQHFLQNTPELDAYIIYADVDGEVEAFSTQGFEDILL